MAPSLETASIPETVVDLEAVAVSDTVGVRVTAAPSPETASVPETAVDSEAVAVSDTVGVRVTAAPSLETASVPEIMVSSVGVEQVPAEDGWWQDTAYSQAPQCCSEDANSRRSA